MTPNSAETLHRSKLVTIPRIPIAAVGEWDCMTGKTVFTRSMMESMVEASKDPGIGLPKLKRGHSSTDADPLLGLASNLEIDADGMVYADFAGIDADEAAALPFRYPDRSIEARRNVTSPTTGKTYEFVAPFLALLPIDGAVDTLPDLPLPEYMRGAELVAASMHFDAVVSYTAKHPHENVAASHAGTQHQYGRLTGQNPPTTLKEKSMDYPKLKTLFGMPEDATEEQVRVKATEHGMTLNEGTPTDPPTPPVVKPGEKPNEPFTPPQPGTPTPAPGSEPPTGFQVPDGMALVDNSTLTALQQGVEVAASLRKEKDEEQREAFLDGAVMAGKFPPARVDHYRNLWGADPEGTRDLIDTLSPGLVPVTAESGIMAGKSATGTDGQVDAIAASFGVTNIVEKGA